ARRAAEVSARPRDRNGPEFRAYARRVRSRPDGRGQPAGRHANRVDFDLRPRAGARLPECFSDVAGPARGLLRDPRRDVLAAEERMGRVADALIVDIERRFPSGAAVSAQFDLAMRRGTIAVLFGPSGAGKTTVVRAIAGLDRPDRGLIRV